MELQSGHKLGAFEITGLLGKGGMGEVYRARDTKLGREVAIKVLPEALAADEEYVVRFEREAKVLASLDHSNIATIYDFIGADSDGAHRFLVMQLVEGETLADRIDRGPLPAEEAVGIFSQIAEGLEAAHERGVIHRDLKPANIKITLEGRVKILDFGIAKSTEGFATPGAATPRTNTPSGSGEATKPMSTTPTAFATGPGRFIGTPQYMSPEQARGRPVDKRTDIWAFGVCLYEALTGTAPFGGESATDLVAAIVRDEPNLDRLPASTPPHLRALLCRCLEKNLRFRLRDIGEAWYSLNHPTKPDTARTALPAEREITRFTVSFPANHYLSTTFAPLAISPDGRMIACALTCEGNQQLYVRSMDALDFRPVPGTERARAPFFSYDGKWLGFFQRRTMRAAPIGGGAIRTIVECEETPVNGVWTPDDVLVWGEFNSGLQMIKPDGTGRKTITAPDKEKGETWHTPLGNVGTQGWILTHLISDGNRSVAGFVSTRTGERRTISELRVVTARHLNSGHTVSSRPDEPELFAIRTPGDPPRPSGEPVKVLGEVAVDSDRIPLYDLSATGSLVYAPAGSGRSPNKLFWVTRNGARQEITAPPNRYYGLKLSPDGELLATVCRDRANVSQVHMLDLRRGVLEKLTSEEQGAVTPIWHPGGNHLAYSTLVTSSNTVRLLSLDDHSIRVIQESPKSAWTSDYSFDGRHLAFSRSRTPIDFRIYVRNEAGEEEVIVDAQCRNVCPRFSPSGEYIAYASNESGRWEVYVRPFHRPGRRIQVSLDGGSDPVWARDGAELFYRNGDTVMAVRVETSGTMRVGQPEALFDFPFGETASLYSAGFDVHPDGDRFVMLENPSTDFGATELVVVRNWGEEIKKLLPPE